MAAVEYAYTAVVPPWERSLKVARSAGTTPSMRPAAGTYYKLILKILYINFYIYWNLLEYLINKCGQRSAVQHPSGDEREARRRSVAMAKARANRTLMPGYTWYGQGPRGEKDGEREREG